MVGISLNKKLYMSSLFILSWIRGGWCMLAFFTQDATQEEELFHNVLCTSRLLSGRAAVWAYKWGQAGFEEWARDNRGGRGHHCWIIPYHINSAITGNFSARNNMVPGFSCGTQWGGFAEHINFALVEMTVSQLPFIVREANLTQSFHCQRDVWMQSSQS